MSATRRACAALATTLVFAATACAPADSGSTTSAPVLSDSAGVRLIEYGGDLTGEPMPLELLWEQGRGPGDYTFQTVGSGAVLPDGGAVIADAGNQEVVALTADGAGWTMLAGPGRGPGEVSLPRLVLAVGQDTIWVDDAGSRKIMRFDGGTLALTLGRAATGGMGLMGVDGHGGIFLMTASARPDFPQDWLEGRVARFDLAQSRLDTIARYPLASRQAFVTQNPLPPFGSVQGAGEGFVHVRSDLPELTWRNAAGDVTQIVRWNPKLTYPTDTTWNEFSAHYFSEMRRVNPHLTDGQVEELVRERLATYSLDPSVPLPLFGLIVGGSDGSVWVPPFDPGGSPPTEYTVVSADGMSVQRASFPGGLTVISANEGYVLGVSQDDLGVQAVAVYRR